MSNVQLRTVQFYTPTPATTKKEGKRSAIETNTDKTAQNTFQQPQVTSKSLTLLKRTKLRTLDTSPKIDNTIRLHAKNNSLIKASEEKSLSVNGTKITITAKNAQIPGDAATLLTTWKIKNKTKLAENDKRISYDTKNNDISQALEKFQTEYGGNWHIMKEKCTDKKTLQIINDLRAAYLEKIFSNLRAKYPDLAIADFGSSNLTSDRDFAFIMGSLNQSRETEITGEFNKQFESLWGIPSAHVFDSNAYTMQYLLSASDPKTESNRSQMQKESSLLMQARTSPENWEEFKEQTLSKISNHEVRSKKAEEFDRVDAQSAELTFLLDKEIVKFTLNDQKAKEIIAPQENFLNKSSFTAEEKDQIREMAEKSKKINPQCEVLASNALSQRFKEYNALEGIRSHLTLEIMKLQKEGEHFETNFNSLIDKTIKNLEKQPDTENFIRKLNNAKISEGKEEAAAVREAFQAKIALDTQEKAINKELAQRTGNLLSLEKQLAKETTFEAGATFSLKELQNLSTNHRNGVNPLHEQIKAIKSEIREIKASIEGIKKEREDLITKYGETWEKAGALGLVNDALLIQTQKSNLLGMCFAQEAHVSEGAFAFVVLNIQAKEIEARSLNQYTQGYREIHAFYGAHQAHKTSAHDKMVEVSKYADRLMVGIQTITWSASKLAVTVDPTLQDKNLDTLHTFFKQALNLRGKGKSETEIKEGMNAAAKELRKIGILPQGESFELSDMEIINKKMEDLASTIEAWSAAIEENKFNALP